MAVNRFTGIIGEQLFLRVGTALTFRLLNKRMCQKDFIP